MMKSTFIASCIAAIAMSANLDYLYEGFEDDTESLQNMQKA